MSEPIKPVYMLFIEDDNDMWIAHSVHSDKKKAESWADCLQHDGCTTHIAKIDQMKLSGNSITLLKSVL